MSNSQHSTEPAHKPVPSVATQRHRQRQLAWGAAGVGVCVLLLTGWFVSRVNAASRVMPGVHAADMDLSRLDRAQIEARLDAWAEQRNAQRIEFTLAESRVLFEPKAVGFVLDTSATVSAALGAGRQGGFFANFASFVARWFRPEQVSLAVRFDSRLLATQLEVWQNAALKDAPFAGGVHITGASVAPLYPRSGRRIDAGRTEAQLRAALLSGHATEPLATRLEVPKVERAEVDRVVALAQTMLQRDVELATADGARRLQVSPTQLASLLVVQQATESTLLSLSCSTEGLEQLLQPRRAELEQQSQNARFVIDAQDHVRVEPGRSGLLLNTETVARALCAAAQTPEKKAELPLSPGAEPKVSTQLAEHAGVVGLMGTYTTRHACCQPRVQNIHHIADLLDNTLVYPGEIFSVNQLVGPRTVKNGFSPAPTIEDGDMVDTVGGGVSQFATTLFNALFYGGYDILERQPHSYWFTRYPMGYDATLSYPHPDIVFKNDTDAGALIKTHYTDTTITVKVYGNNGGRRVRAEVSPRQNIVPPPIEFIPNPRLDADEEKTREGGMIGWTVTVKRTLTFPDGKIKEERRKVTYKPRARRVEVHPCRIPAGEPGHTGERCPVPEKEPGDDANGSEATDARAK